MAGFCGRDTERLDLVKVGFFDELSDRQFLIGCASYIQLNCVLISIVFFRNDTAVTRSIHHRIM